MEKLWLIIKREYLTRVKKRSFILATLLTPLAFGLFFIVVGFIFSYESGDTKQIVISDPANILRDGNFAQTKSLHFTKSKKDLEDLKKLALDNKYDGILVLPELKNIKEKTAALTYYSESQLALDARMDIERSARRFVRNHKIVASGIDESLINSLDTKVRFEPKSIIPKEKEESNLTSVIAALIGGTMGFIMYMTVFIYGMMVMRSVMEEKVNRIVEVMISSVKPFQLMMGKIIGVGAVGLTQVGIWAILIPTISFLVQLVFGFDANSMNAPGADMAGAAAAEIDPEDAMAMFQAGWEELKSQNWLMIFPLFIFYFLGGYFLYASMFAAVGSAMGDDLGEGQALTIPITIPVIIAFYIMVVAVRSPDSSLAVWSSIFPLFSPIVMPARLAFSPPAWQVILSMVVLAASSVFFVWLSARIYRVGILMYGKKVTLKELGKWMFYSD